MTDLTWLPNDVALDKPSSARMYDYLLGGYHNFAIDRKAAEQLMAINPDAPLIMQANRAFLRRAVKFLVEQGIDQFLDIGSVTPTVGSTHEVAGHLKPTARVVYVDIDPDTVRHSKAILRGNPLTAAIEVDVRRPEQLLSHPEVRRLLDFSKPMAVLVALLMFVTDDEIANNLVRVLCDAVAPGSYLVISQGTNEGSPPEVVERLEALYARSTQPVKLRSRAEFAAYFHGLELVEPGLVWVPLWHPDSPDDLFLDHPSESRTLGGVGRKP
jgi:hypothetical protein